VESWNFLDLLQRVCTKLSWMKHNIHSWTTLEEGDWYFKETKIKQETRSGC